MFQSIRSRQSHQSLSRLFPVLGAAQSITCADDELIYLNVLNQPRDESADDTLTLPRENPDASTFPLCLAWNHVDQSSNQSMLAVGDEGGYISLFQESLEQSFKQSSRNRTDWMAHDNSISGLVWAANPSVDRSVIQSINQIGSCSADTTCAVWDIETQQSIYQMGDHSAAVKSIDFNYSTQSYVSGGRDGRAIIWDVRTQNQKQSIIDRTFTKRTVRVKHTGERSPSSNLLTRPSVTAAKFISNNHIACSSSSSPIVHLFDRRNTSQPFHSLGSFIRDTGRRHLGVVDLTVDVTGRYLAAAITDSLIYSYELDNFDCLGYYKGHTSTYYQRVAFDQSANYIATSSTDGAIYIYKHQMTHSIPVNQSINQSNNPPISQSINQSINEFAPLTVLQGHTDESSGVQWKMSYGALTLASVSDDETIRIWRAGDIDYDCLQTVDEYDDIQAHLMFKQPINQSTHMHLESNRTVIDPCQSINVMDDELPELNSISPSSSLASLTIMSPTSTSSPSSTPSPEDDFISTIETSNEQSSIQQSHNQTISPSHTAPTHRTKRSAAKMSLLPFLEPVSSFEEQPVTEERPTKKRITLRDHWGMQTEATT